MARVIAGIAYEELKGTGKITMGPQGIVGTRIFKVVYSRAVAFALTVLTSMNKGTQTPMYYWPLDNGMNLYPKTVELEGLGKCLSETDYPGYTFARVTVTYEELPSAAQNKNKKIPHTMSVDYSAEFITIAPGSYKFDDGAYLPQNIGILMPTIERTITLKNCKVIPETALRGCRGRVNEGTFFGADPETVLFLGAATDGEFVEDPITGVPAKEQELAMNGIYTSVVSAPKDIVLKFKERMVSWNYAYDPAEEAWREIFPPPYEAVNFDQLFK